MKISSEEPLWFLYRHIRLDTNQVFYIGIGKSKGKNNHLKSRAYSQHGRNNYWKNIVSQTSYRVEIVLDELTHQQAIDKEIEFIKLYGRVDLKEGTLVNFTNGGEGRSGSILSQSAKEAISRASKGRILSKEARLKISQAGKGRIVSDETRAKMRITNSHVFTEERKQKIKLGLKKFYQNNTEVREKIKKQKIERFQDKTNHPMFGKPRSEETKQKIREKLKGHVFSEETKQKIKDSLKKRREGLKEGEK